MKAYVGKADGYLTVTAGRKVLFYKVNDLAGYRYKLNKRSISADGGVDALSEWLVTGWDSLTKIALTQIVEKVQPVKVLTI